MFKHSLCVGSVWHKRYSPKIHEFRYKLNSWLIDLRELNKLAGNSPFINNKRAALYRFKENQYLRDFPGNLIDKVRQKLINLGADINGVEEFYLLGQVSNLGLYFSPLNLYLCYTDKNCTYILAEVSNTPWNERYYYLLDMSKDQIISEKNFHVSPFFGMKQKYYWQFNINERHITFKIDSYEDTKLVFSAGYSGSLYNLKDKSTKYKILRTPANVYKIISGIYFEALFIWLKKIPFVPYHKKP